MGKDSIQQKLNAKFLCREKQVELLCDLLNQNSYSSYQHPCILLHGNQSTGKLSLIKHFLHISENIKHVIANCTTLYTHKLLVEHILNNLYDYKRSEQAHLERCDNFVTLVCDLKKIATKNCEQHIIIVLKNCEKLDRLSLNTLIRVQEYTGCPNITVVLITTSTPCSLQVDQVLPKIHFNQYSKDQLMKILIAEKPDGHPVDFFENFLNAFVGTLYNVVRDLREMKNLISNVFPKYVEPVVSGELAHSDVVSLWRHIAPYLKSAINNAYLGFVTNTHHSVGPLTLSTTQSLRMKLLDLPFYTKYFLIASYLASFISPKYDRRLFVKATLGKRSKKRNVIKIQNEKIESELLGAKSFSLDRLLAIFYAIVDEAGVNLTANLLAQVTSLVELKLLTALSDGNLDKPNYKCSVDKETIYAISKTVDFNIKKYLDVS
uniref:Origin recognition complex subunit 5 n=1 Tax=Cacopsylla melanoneura TaxID=428564 RepID=A0A8D9EQX5_9HEMI